MYARDVGGERLDFGVSGKLVLNALVMFDRQTETLWSQFLGRALEGPLAGTELTPLPATLMRWGRWRALHPDTTALDQGRVVIDAYSNYYLRPDAGVIGERNRDDRLFPKTLVLGLTLPEGRKAYAHHHLADAPALNDRVGGQPVLVAWDGEARAAAAFDPAVDGRVLAFDAAEPGPDGEARLRDRETGTLWRALTGEALEGELAGRRLERLPAFAVFWFAWSDYFPDTLLHEPPP